MMSIVIFDLENNLAKSEQHSADCAVPSCHLSRRRKAEGRKATSMAFATGLVLDLQ